MIRRGHLVEPSQAGCRTGLVQIDGDAYCHTKSWPSRNARLA
jgi:hypothetical protein